jgi:hypothetical protein
MVTIGCRAHRLSVSLWVLFFVDSQATVFLNDGGPKGGACVEELEALTRRRGNYDYYLWMTASVVCQSQL